MVDSVVLSGAVFVSGPEEGVAYFDDSVDVYSAWKNYTGIRRGADLQISISGGLVVCHRVAAGLA